MGILMPKRLVSPAGTCCIPLKLKKNEAELVCSSVVSARVHIILSFPLLSLGQRSTTCRRQLGYLATGAHVAFSIEYQAGTPKIVMAGIKCSGDENSLSTCNSNLKSRCLGSSFQRVVGLTCSLTPPKHAQVRLVPRPSNLRSKSNRVVVEGRLEVYVGQQWGTACDRNFDIRLDRTIDMRGYRTRRLYQLLAPIHHACIYRLKLGLCVYAAKPRSCAGNWATGWPRRTLTSRMAGTGGASASSRMTWSVQVLLLPQLTALDFLNWFQQTPRVHHYCRLRELAAALQRSLQLSAAKVHSRRRCRCALRVASLVEPGVGASELGAQDPGLRRRLCCFRVGNTAIRWSSKNDAEKLQTALRFAPIVPGRV